jgi:hypothetical protein
MSEYACYAEKNGTKIAYNELVQALSAKYPTASKKDAFYQMLKVYYDPKGAYFVADEPVPAWMMESVLATSWITGIDCPETDLPVDCFRGINSKYCVRIGAILISDSITIEHRREFTQLVAKSGNILLMKPLTGDAIDRVIRVGNRQLRHINISLNNEAELWRLFHYATNLCSLVVRFIGLEVISLRALHETIPNSLQHLVVKSRVQNPVNEKITRIGSVISLSIRPTDPFDYDFFKNNQNRFEELRINRNVMIPVTDVNATLINSSQLLEVLDVSDTALPQDILFVGLLGGNCCFLRILRADRPRNSGAAQGANAAEIIGFSSKEVKKYLESSVSMRLEILTLCGHMRLTSDILKGKISCIQTLRKLDLRKTGCVTDSNVQNLCKQKDSRPSNIRRRLQRVSSSGFEEMPPEVLEVYLSNQPQRSSPARTPASPGVALFHSLQRTGQQSSEAEASDVDQADVSELPPPLKKLKKQYQFTTDDPDTPQSSSSLANDPMEGVASGIDFAIRPNVLSGFFLPSQSDDEASESGRTTTDYSLYVKVVWNSEDVITSERLSKYKIDRILRLADSFDRQISVKDHQDLNASPARIERKESFMEGLRRRLSTTRRRTKSMTVSYSSVDSSVSVPSLESSKLAKIESGSEDEEKDSVASVEKDFESVEL